MRSNPNNILIVDFWSDKNRGDAAMQISTLKLLRLHSPVSHLTVMTAYGWNQEADLAGELDESSKFADRVVGGIRPTFTPLSSTGVRSRVLRKAAMLGSTFLFLCASPFWRIVAGNQRVRSLLPAALGRSLAAIHEADLVVWNGRNFRSDSRARESYEIWQLLYNPRVCQGLGKPVAMIGASVWPLGAHLSRWILRRAIDANIFTSVRERNSLSELESLLGGQRSSLVLLPDLSFATIRTDATDKASLRDLPGFPRKVALTLVDWRNGGDAVRSRYVAGVVALCEHLYSRGTEEIAVVPQVTYGMEGISEIQKEIDRALGGRLEIAEVSDEVSSLSDAYTAYDFLIATRMHSAIFAACRGVPLMTIPYDSGGKWGILDELGLHDIGVPYAEADGSALISKFEAAWSDRQAQRDAVARHLPKLSTQVHRNVVMPLEAYDDFDSTHIVARLTDA